jgi:hypothetical protein
MTTLYTSGNKCHLESFLLFCMFLLFITGCNSTPGTKPEETHKTATSPPAKSDVVKESPESIAGARVSADSIQTLLKGKWLRSDGSYTIEIFSVKEDGKMDAGYFNPNPINVGNAEWTLSDDIVLIRIILKDANYPGSKYNLIYDRKSDCLAGNYFQAVQGINYDVIFTRKK